MPAKVMGLSIVLSDAVFPGHFFPSLTCRRPAPRSTPHTSVSKYRGSFFVVEFYVCIFFDNSHCFCKAPGMFCSSSILLSLMTVFLVLTYF